MSRRLASFAPAALASILPDCVYPLDPAYCPGKDPNNNCLGPALDPGSMSCTTNAECSGDAARVAYVDPAGFDEQVVIDGGRVVTFVGGPGASFTRTNGVCGARGAADPRSSLTGLAARDLDGDVRTRPADIGADEVS
ncbi:MAG TPA: hypothetical protein VNO30_50715 [Kofleriaceae bacterium]|nr:hypothetical protein [Kofleriaceae bacterium]